MNNPPAPKHPPRLPPPPRLPRPLQGKLSHYLWRLVEMTSICLGLGTVVLPYLATLNPMLLASILWIALWLVVILAVNLYDKP